jgi:hypothetical protein
MPSTKNSEAVHLAALMARQFIIMAKDIINPRISLSLVMESANAMSKVDPKVRRDNTHSTSFAEWKSNLQRSNRDRWRVHAALIDRAPPTSRRSPDALLKRGDIATRGGRLTAWRPIRCAGCTASPLMSLSWAFRLGC